MHTHMDMDMDMDMYMDMDMDMDMGTTRGLVCQSTNYVSIHVLKAPKTAPTLRPRHLTQTHRPPPPRRPRRSWTAIQDASPPAGGRGVPVPL